MNTKNYVMRSLLIFELDDALFCVDATEVRETVWLPELTPVEDVPPYIAGIFSLRGEFVPVIDLNLRFAHPARPYRLSDQIVVLELDQQLTGLIVSEVREVTDIDERELSNSAYDVFSRSDLQSAALSELPAPHCVFKLVQLGDDLVMQLDIRQLMQRVPEQGDVEVPVHRFLPQATPELHAIFRSRAIALMEPLPVEDDAPLALAVVELGGEYYGIAPGSVQEFCDIGQATLIPCCPPHIIGAISLRGNQYTLLDIRRALNLSCASQRWNKAVITRATGWADTQFAGVAVDAVHDVIYFRQDELQSAPVTLRDQPDIMGAVHYAGRMMVVLDLPALLARDEWIVNDPV